MRLALDPRARRLLRRVPRTNIYSAMELLLLSLLAMQCARLVWTIVTPVDPVGNWRASSALQPPRPAETGLLTQFDPFFRLNGEAGPVVVTSLDLKLFGVREDRASGRGSAIIGSADGQQRSYAVGDEISPGVTLTAVTFEGVTISRNGTAEQLFLDQSPPANVVSPDGDTSSTPMTESTLAAPPPPAPAEAPATPAAPANLTNEVQFQPRMNGGQVSGVTVQPQGNGEAFHAAGLAPGDVIVSVGGRRINSANQASAIAREFSGQREVTIQVERGGRTIPLRVRPGQ